MGWRSAVLAGGLAGLVAAAAAASRVVSIDSDVWAATISTTAVLAGVLVLVGAYGAIREAGALWAVQAAAAAVAPVLVVLGREIALDVGDRESSVSGPGVGTAVHLAIYVGSAFSTAVFAFATAALAGLAGWGVVELGRLVSARRRRRADGHA